MARLTFPDEGSRLVFRMTGSGKPLLSAAAGTATIYADSAGATRADIQTLEGVTVASSTLTVTAASQLPLFLGPDNIDTVWCSVDGGPLSPVYARNDDRIDSLVASVGTVVRSVNGSVPDGTGNVAIAAGAVMDATDSVKGVVQLAGDLGGTSVAPTTPTAVHKAGAETIEGVKTFNAAPILPVSSVPFDRVITTGTKTTSTVLAGTGAFVDRFPLGSSDNPHMTKTSPRNAAVPVNHYHSPDDPASTSGGTALAGDVWLGELAP